MTKVLEQPTTCALCHKESPQLQVYSYNTFGETPYLDFYRSNEPVCLQECPHCHFAAPNIADNADGVTEDMLTRRELKRLVKDGESEPRAAALLLLAAYFCEQTDNLEQAGVYYHKASWEYLNIGDEATANTYMQKALDRLVPFAFKDGNNVAFVCVDLYRRLGKFKESEELIGKIGEVQDQPKKDIIKYQLKLIKKQDTQPHKLEDNKRKFSFKNLFKRKPLNVR